MLSSGWIPRDQLEVFVREQTTAHRLYSSSRAWVDRFGSDALISFRDVEALPQIETQLADWIATTGLKVERIFSRLLPKHNEERAVPSLLKGGASGDLRTVATEGGLRFGIDFSAGYSVGLFIDQRANRSFTRQLKPQRFLNCFAYTCSFSVCAALGGGKTVSIDLSKKSLERGKENFALNDLALSGHRFLADDVMDVLPRMARKGEQFDAIVLDPPTFSRGVRGRKFQAELDFETLLIAALDVAARPAKILVSTNCTRLDGRALERLGRFCLRARRRSALFHRQPSLPDVRPGDGAETLWLLLQ